MIFSLIFKVFLFDLSIIAAKPIILALFFLINSKNEFGDLTGNKKMKTFYNTYETKILTTMIIYIGFCPCSYSHFVHIESGNHTKWTKRLGCVCWM